MMVLNINIFFMLFIFSASVFSDVTDDEAPTYVFGDIFKGIPTLFEYLLEMVEQRPEVLETNDIELMKREIVIDHCEECDRAKREVIRDLKHLNVPISHDTTSKVAGESLQVTNKRVGNIAVYKEVSSKYITEYANQKREISLQPHSKTGPVPCNLEKRESRTFLDDNTKRKNNYEICSKTLHNAEHKRNVDKITKSINENKISSTKEINVDNFNNKRIYINKNNLENRRHSRHKKLASDPNTPRTFSLTPEEVEEHIFKVDQLLEEHKENRTN